MASFSDHLEKAEHNQSVVSILRLSDKRPFDWMITITFYSAFHYLHAILDLKCGAHPDSYKKLERLIDPQGSYKFGLSEDACDLYMHLQNASWKVRYMTYNPNNGKTSGKNVSEQVFNDVEAKFLELKSILLAEIESSKAHS